MQVRCPSCQARYKLDDAKVGDVPIRVKCSKCAHVFKVARPKPIDDVDEIPDFSPDDGDDETRPASSPSSPPDLTRTRPIDDADRHPPMKEGFRGSLEAIGLPDIIQMLHLGRKTGALHIKRGDEANTLFFVEGEIVTATTNVAHNRMAAFLHRREKISGETMASILEEADTTGKSEELLIRESVPVPPEKHQERVNEYVAELIYGIFHWSTGSLRFIEHEIPPSECQRVTHSTQNLVMEGVRRIDEWGRIRQAFPSEDVILRQCPEPSTKVDQILLNSDEWKIMALVDGRNTIREICIEAKQPEFEISRILYGLLSIGLLEKAGIREPEVPKFKESESRRTLVFTASKLIMKGKEGKEDMVIPLSMGQITIGRSSKESDVPIPEDGHASRVHAQVRYEDKHFVVMDRGSTNGTFVNGERIESAILNHNDILRVGQTEFLFIEKEETQKPGSASPHH